MPPDAPMRECDLVVVGSGASGMTAAVTAAILGLDVVVLEKEPQLGGTSAWSGGWMWIPRNPLAVESGFVEDIEAPKRYLRAELGDAYDEAFATMFLSQGPRMVRFLRDEAHVEFVAGAGIPDFHDTSDGAGFGNRSVCSAPFDGRKLGKDVARLKPPLDEVSPFGMGIASGADMTHFLNATRRPASFAHVARRVLAHWRDLAVHGRGMHLVNGNGLVARLFRAALDHHVALETSSPVVDLLIEGGRATGAVADTPSGRRTFRARRGVVLAAGGFPHDVARKAKMFAHAPTGREHFSAAPRSNTGDGLRLGEAAGGRVREDLSNTGAWAPVSLTPKRNGDFGSFPHLVERAKPGLIMVTVRAERFANEADSYHDVMQALFAATPAGETAEAWMICDHPFQRRYGLGRARPRPYSIRPWLSNGYLKRASTIEGLAKQCGLDPRRLAQTVADYNSHAANGVDPTFRRGESAYNKAQGDPETKPNPCVAPIANGPFYAVKIVAGSLGTFAGLLTDEFARVLDGDGAPVAGLYAVGADMSSMM
ncbi:MAG: FAD-dependent oxidoreductase, partial [Hyphomicrobiales bacterium]|nr:FAD-dependent oxidoreductase [Hyphomicrobiales bacterium]